MARWRKNRAEEEESSNSPSSGDAASDSADAEVIEIWNDERGMLISGGAPAVDALVRRLTTPEPGQPSSLVPTDATDALAVFSSGFADGATTLPSAAQYFQHTPRSLALLAEHGPIGTENGAFRSFVHNGTGFAGNLDWQPADLGSQRALVMQTTAIGMALRLAVKEVSDAVARVEGQVDRLVGMFRSERLGDAVGDHRTLEAMVEKCVGATGSPPRTGRLLPSSGPSSAGTSRPSERTFASVQALPFLASAAEPGPRRVESCWATVCWPKHSPHSSWLSTTSRSGRSSDSSRFAATSRHISRPASPTPALPLPITQAKTRRCSMNFTPWAPSSSTPEFEMARPLADEAHRAGGTGSRAASSPVRPPANTRSHRRRSS